jgi:spore coat polysaccharide biosynthesis protein SpsF
VSGVVVATSVDSTDDPIVEFCSTVGVPVYRGPLEDTARRFLGVVDRWRPRVFVRISGDSPFMDPSLIDEAVARSREGYQVVTNIARRTYPRGESVEVIDAELFRAVLPYFAGSDDLEHVTPYFYRNLTSCRYFSMELAAEDFSAVNLCVDTGEDLARVVSIVEQMDRPFHDYHWREIVSIYAKLHLSPSSGVSP